MAKLVLAALACGLCISKLPCDFVPARMAGLRAEAPRHAGAEVKATSANFTWPLAMCLASVSVASARHRRLRLRAEGDTEAKAEDSPEAEEEMADEDEEDEEDKDDDEGDEGDEDESEEKPSKWKCLDCGSMNFAAATECEKCGAVKPSPAEAKLVEERDQAKDEVAKVMDGFLRMQADLQNYRRQHAEAMARAKDLGKLDALKKLLPFNEDMAAALVEPEGMEEKDKAIHDSYSLLFRKVGDVWAKDGIQSLTATVGDKFDDINHVAVEEREAEGEPGTILEVLKSGYKYDGKVVLPVEVVVVASEADAEEADAEEADAEKDSESPEEENAEETAEAAA